MSYPFNYPTPTNANVQIFVGTGITAVTSARTRTWVKPQGASFVWFTLIGCGGNGDATNGGGSGAVTNCLMPAFLIPDSLLVTVGGPGNVQPCRIYWQGPTATNGYILLAANTGGTPAGGVASAANAFAAAGFYQNVTGQAGSTSNIGSSTTTFLSGGGGNSTIQSNYGYVNPPGSGNGYFQLQPIIVGLGGGSGGDGGIGCGGAVGTRNGGAGMAVIISW